MTVLNRAAGREPFLMYNNRANIRLLSTLALLLAFIIPLAPVKCHATDIRTHMAALDDPNPKTRVMAARALGLMGAEARPAIDKLVLTMGDDNRLVQKEASLALRNIGKTAAPALRQALTNSNPRIREGAALALGKMGAAADPAIPDLIQLLTDRDYEVKNAAEFALRRIGEPAVPFLKEAKGKGGVLGSAAEKILNKMGR